MSTTRRPVRGPRRRRATFRCGVGRCPGSAGALLFAGAIVALVVFVGNTASPKETFSNEPAVDVTKPQKNIKVPAEVQAVAQKFIKTAVARKNLESAYDHRRPVDQAGHDPGTEWKTGNIAVIPFPVDKLDYAPFKVDYAHSRTS